MQYFALLSFPFLFATAGLLVGVLSQGIESTDARWMAQVLLIAVLLCFSAFVYFVLLGLLAELVVKASDLHGSERGRRIATLNVSAGGTRHA